MKRFVSRGLPLALFLMGFMLLVVGVLYLITPVEALPAFLGGIQRSGLHADAYRTKRADVALILGVLLLIASWWVYRRSVERLPELPIAEDSAEPSNAPRKDLHSDHLEGRLTLLVSPAQLPLPKLAQDDGASVRRLLEVDRELRERLGPGMAE